MSEKLTANAWELVIPPGPKIVLLAFCKDAPEYGMVEPSVGALAKLCGTTTRSVRNHITWLEKQGLLGRKAIRGKSNLYFIKLLEKPTFAAFSDGANPNEPDLDEDGESHADSSSF